MSDVLSDRISVTVEQNEYVFRIPTIRYDVELGYKSADVRRRCYPEGGGMLGAVDYGAVQFSRSCAILELYLTSASTLWPYGFDDSDMGKVDLTRPPKVDFEKFPLSAAETVTLVGEAFEAAFARFRKRGSVNDGSAGA